MPINKIKQLDDLIKPILINNDNKTYIDHTERNLLAPGENCGSLILSMEIKTKNRDNQETIIHAVAKLLPTVEFLQKAFNVNVTFRAEVEFYRTILPQLQQFQRDQGVAEVIDFFPKYYGSRISLNPVKDTVDETSVLLLENLSLSGYQMGDRLTGFDLQAAEFVLKDLARFHAVPIAMKLLKPDVFNTKIKPYLKKKRTPPVDKLAQDRMIDRNIATIEDNESCKALIPNLRRLMEKYFETVITSSEYVSEPFGTITHMDFWLNNTMIKIIDNKVVSNKIVDFQLYEYGSPARDVIFFLYTSVRIDVIAEYYDHFIDIYYDTFLATLEEMKCDAKQFTREAFEKELQGSRHVEFCRCLGMAHPILAERGTTKKMDEMKEGDMFSKPITQRIKAKCSFIVNEFVQRKWI